jgi:hypothetical protein
MRRYSTILVMLVLVTGLSACGTRGGVSVEDTLDGRELLAAAPAATREAGTAHMTMLMELSGSGLGAQQDGVTVTGTGQIDFDGPLMSLTMDMAPVAPGAGTLSYIMTPDAMYMSVPAVAEQQVGASWLRMRYADLDEELGIDVQQMMSGQATDPTAMLDQLHGVTDDIDDLGEEVIDGILTTHYRATISRDAVIANTPEDSRAGVESLLETSGFPETYAVEVWIDGDNLVRRMTTAMSMQGIDQAITVTWSDYGAPVDIQVPTESIIDYRDFMERTSGTSPIPG